MNLEEIENGDSANVEFTFPVGVGIAKQESGTLDRSGEKITLRWYTGNPQYGGAKANYRELSAAEVKRVTKRDDGVFELALT